MISISGQWWASMAGVALLVAAGPAAAQPSALRLLDEDLRPPAMIVALDDAKAEPPALAGAGAILLALADAKADQDRPAPPEQADRPKEQGTQQGKEGETGAKPPALDFDLLGKPAVATQVDESALQLRRTMLTIHQGVGLGMFGLELATTVVGQLNYIDKFGGDNTNKYKQTHAILAYSTLAAFVAAGTLALLAPSPIKRDTGFDRVSLHKIAMFTAAGGMLTQAVLGIWTKDREGYLNQQGIATAHLVIGYVTLAAVTTGIAALIL